MASRDLPAPIRIRHAALQLFAARGFDATGIREIAEVAAIPTSLLYHYRRSKEEILRDLILEGLARHLESSRRALDLAESPEEGIRTMVGIHVLVPIRNPEMARIMESEVRALGPASQELVRVKRVEGDQRWQSVLRDGLAAGIFTVPEPRFAGRLLRRLCTGIGVWYTPGEPMAVDELITRLSDHALALVRARRDGTDVRGDDLVHPTIGQLQAIVDGAHSEDLDERVAG
ncbi:MAG: TetR family transcriptional regulator [Candidatus Dormibacteraeota bacterium]|nr:TetR family transcriptional regulator [Candidatus Dormibacteraeota bacterium]